MLRVVLHPQVMQPARPAAQSAGCARHELTLGRTGALVAVFLLAGACIAESSRQGGQKPAAFGGTLVISASGDPESLFPPLAATIPARIVGDLVYDRLAEIGDSLNTVGDHGFQPRLAQRWDWAADSLSVAFHLDPAARWHDGHPVRASDVRFTHALYADSATGSPFVASLSGLDSVTIRDSLTAVFWFRDRSPMQFYDAVNTMSILPEHRIGTVRGQALRTAPIARSPVGTGRFRFVRWDPGAAIELAADSTSFRGRPGLDRVIMTVAPDFNTALARLLGGEADMLEQVPATALAQIAGDTSLRVTLGPSLEYNFLQFNLREPRRRDRPHPVLGERALRRALTAATDRARIVRSAYDSLALPAIGPTVRVFPSTDTTLTQIPYDPAGAARLLDSLGWRDADGDGIRERGGRRLEFSLGVPSSSRARSVMAVLIQEQMRQVGARVNIEPLDFAAFTDRQTRRDFDAMLAGWQVDPGPGGIRQTWGGASAGRGASNHGSYDNPAFDAHVDSALAANSVDGRRAHFTKAYSIILGDAPAIWLAEPRRAMVVHRRVETRGIRAGAWWANLADWSIPTERRIARDRPAPAR